MKKAVLLSALLGVASFSFVACGGYTSILTTRVVASQSVSSPASFPGLIVVNGENDTLARAAEIGAGNSPGLMTLSPDRSTLLAFDSSSNSVEIINTVKQSLTGSIFVGGPTTSMVALAGGSGYAAVPSATFIGSPPGAIVVMNITSGGLNATVSVPSAQTVISNPAGTLLLVFSNDSDVVTIISPLLVNTGNPVTALVPGFDHPVYGVFSADGSTAYILNCGPECGGVSASVQALNMATLTVGTPVPVDAATIGWLNGSTLYVAGTATASTSNPAPNNSCKGQTTAATTCGRIDLINTGSMTVTGSAVITDGYHDRIDMGNNGQLFIGSQGCTNIGNVNNPQGEVRGCLSIFNTNTSAVVIPPDNGDVTGLQSFTTRYVEYVAEGGNLRVYNTQIDSLLLTTYIETGTITIRGQVTDVKAIDFF